jgi:hypothetical protein
LLHCTAYRQTANDPNILTDLSNNIDSVTTDSSALRAARDRSEYENSVLHIHLIGKDWQYEACRCQAAGFAS